MSDLALPPDYPTVPSAMYEDRQMLRLAREIAMGINDLPDILHSFNLTHGQFETIQKDPAFSRMLASELADWEAASNAEERVKVKSAAMIEDFLPELYARLNDHTEPLLGKAKLLEFIAKLAKMGQAGDPKALAPGDRVVVNINLGADANLRYEKRLPSQVIDHEPQQDQNVSTDIV